MPLQQRKLLILDEHRKQVIHFYRSLRWFTTSERIIVVLFVVVVERRLSDGSC